MMRVQSVHNDQYGGEYDLVGSVNLGGLSRILVCCKANPRKRNHQARRQGKARKKLQMRFPRSQGRFYIIPPACLSERLFIAV